MSTENSFLHEDLSYEVLGCAFEAFKTVGVGFDEVRYHKFFHQYLLQRGLDAQYKVSVHLDYMGERIADLEIDEIVEKRLIVELKAIQTNFRPEDFAQIMTYLKITKLRLGLLINFGLHKAYPKRVIFDEQKEENIGHWDKDFFRDPSMRKLIDATIAAVRNVDKSLGAAYHSKIYQAAMRVELNRNQLDYDDNVRIGARIENIQFRPFKIDFWLVEKSLLLGILAGKDKPRGYDILRMRSYLRKLNLRHGLIAYWSVRNLQLFGIYEH